MLYSFAFYIISVWLAMMTTLSTNDTCVRGIYRSQVESTQNRNCDTELWCSLCCYSGKVVEQAVELSVIWDNEAHCFLPTFLCVSSLTGWKILNPMAVIYHEIDKGLQYMRQMGSFFGIRFESSILYVEIGLAHSICLQAAWLTSVNELDRILCNWQQWSLFWNTYPRC